MWALLVFSLAAFAITVERAWALRRATIDFDRYGQRLKRLLVHEKSVTKALTLSCETQGPVARV